MPVKMRICGIYRNTAGTLTDYVIVTSSNSIQKKSKENILLYAQNPEYEVLTCMWDYDTCEWVDGDKVIKSSRNGKGYLKTDGSNTQRDDLEHLIDFTLL